MTFLLQMPLVSFSSHLIFFFIIVDFSFKCMLLHGCHVNKMILPLSKPTITGSGFQTSTIMPLVFRCLNYIKWFQIGNHQYKKGPLSVKMVMDIWDFHLTVYARGSQTWTWSTLLCCTFLCFSCSQGTSKLINVLELGKRLYSRTRVRNPLSVLHRFFRANAVALE